MRRFVLSACFILLAPAAFAQAVTRPTVTVSAGTMHDVRPGADGNSYYAVGLGGEIPVTTRGALTASVGAAARAASDVFETDFGPQSATLYARLGTARASGRLGIAFDLGRGVFESGGTSGINSDGQTAVVAQVSGDVPAGPARLFAQADAAFAIPTDEEFLYATSPDPGAEPTAYPVRVNTGHQGSVQVGAAVPVGPLEVALAVFVSGRTEGSYRFTDVLPPPFVVGNETFVTERESPIQLGYTRAVGLIPSVAYRTPGNGLTLRAEGSFSGYFGLEDVPLGFTLSSGNGPAVRPAVTVSASVRL